MWKYNLVTSFRAAFAWPVKNRKRFQFICVPNRHIGTHIARISLIPNVDLRVRRPLKLPDVGANYNEPTPSLLDQLTAHINTTITSCTTNAFNTQRLQQTGSNEQNRHNHICSKYLCVGKWARYESIDYMCSHNLVLQFIMLIDADQFIVAIGTRRRRKWVVILAACYHLFPTSPRPNQCYSTRLSRLCVCGARACVMQQPATGLLVMFNSHVHI